MFKQVFTAAMLLSVAACSTSTYIKLPENAVLKIERGDQRAHQEGLLKRTPLSWSSAGGAPYRIEKDGEVIASGRMRTRFRPASIFWPPAGALYWPMGFAQTCYDFTKPSAPQCSAETLTELKTKEKQKN